LAGETRGVTRAIRQNAKIQELLDTLLGRKTCWERLMIISQAKISVEIFWPPTCTGGVAKVFYLKWLSVRLKQPGSNGGSSMTRRLRCEPSHLLFRLHPS
jgi:hypothetical protein